MTRKNSNTGSPIKFGIFKHEDILNNSVTTDIVSNIYMPLRRNLYTIFFSGPEGAKHFVDNSLIEIPAFSILFIGPDRLMHFYDQPQKETFILFFTDLMYNRTPRDVHFLQNTQIFHNFSSTYILTPPNEAISYCKTISYLLYTTQLQPENTLQQDLRHNLVQQILIMGTIHSQRNINFNFSEDKDNMLVLEFRTLIHEHFKEEKTVQFYANLLNITEKRLNKATKNTINLSAKEVIIRKIMEEAKWKLIYSPDSIKEISQNLGFLEENNFSAFFQKNEGLRPTQFRITYKTDPVESELVL